MSATKILPFCALYFGLVAGLPPPASAASDAASGLALAQRWCTGCHVVAASGSGGDSAPPFSTIAKRPNQSAGALRAWLAEPHPPMPNLGLSRQQIDDIVAYLESLRAP